VQVDSNDPAPFSPLSLVKRERERETTSPLDNHTLVIPICASVFDSRSLAYETLIDGWKARIKIVREKLRDATPAFLVHVCNNVIFRVRL